MIERDFTNLLRNNPGIVNEKKKFTGLVKDMLPGQSLQVNLLLSLCNIGIHDEINSAASITNAFAYRFVKQLVEDHGVSRINADWAVSVWCVCYGKNILGKPCEIKISTAKSGGQPSIVSDHQSGVKQYQDLFRYKKNSDGKGYSITGFDGENRKTLIFPNTHHNDNVTAIAEGAFIECDVQEAIITEGITVIERRAFNGCTQLKQVYFPESLIEINDSAFSGCGRLNTMALPKRLERIGAYAFASVSVKNIEIPESVYWLGEGAYSNCAGITAVTIPPGIEHINDKSFVRMRFVKKGYFT
jgi:hypothetical protein